VADDGVQPSDATERQEPVADGADVPEAEIVQGGLFLQFMQSQ